MDIRAHSVTSVAVLAEISLRSPRKLFIFTIKKNIQRIKVSKKKKKNFWKKLHWLPLAVNSWWSLVSPGRYAIDVKFYGVFMPCNVHNVLRTCLIWISLTWVCIRFDQVEYVVKCTCHNTWEKTNCCHYFWVRRKKFLLGSKHTNIRISMTFSRIFRSGKDLHYLHYFKNLHQSQGALTYFKQSWKKDRTKTVNAILAENVDFQMKSFQQCRVKVRKQSRHLINPRRPYCSSILDASNDTYHSELPPLQTFLGIKIRLTT